MLHRPIPPRGQKSNAVSGRLVHPPTDEAKRRRTCQSLSVSQGWKMEKKHTVQTATISCALVGRYQLEHIWALELWYANAADAFWCFLLFLLIWHAMLHVHLALPSSFADRQHSCRCLVKISSRRFMYIVFPRNEPWWVWFQEIRKEPNINWN